MGNAQAVADYHITPEEYLSGELIAERRHEYVAGIVYAMSGTTSGHGRIITNISRELSLQLRGRRCEAFTSELKVRIQTQNSHFYYYPDVVVDCGKGANDNLFADEPRVIFEVLSESTERTDRTEKWINYQKLSVLDVYVLVDQYRAAVTVYRRAEGDWKTELLTEANEVLDLPTVGCSLALSAIYERTQLLP